MTSPGARRNHLTGGEQTGAGEVYRPGAGEGTGARCNDLTDDQGLGPGKSTGLQPGRRLGPGVRKGTGLGLVDANRV